MDKPMSSTDLKNFCKKFNYEYNMIDLNKLNNNIDELTEKNYFVFTGNEEDEYNKGNTHHFILLVGNYYFDSYGNVEGLVIPKEIKKLVTTPTQLQEFYDVHKDSVCGEYCCLFLKTIEDNPEEKIIDIPKIFVDEYGLGKERHENDKIIAKEYRELMSR